MLDSPALLCLAGETFFGIVKATTADKESGAVVVLKVLTDFKTLNFLDGKYVREINALGR
jgi:hypothetical protein